MDRDQESEQGKKPEKPGRGWTERLTGPVRYRRFNDIDAGGRPSIFFKFEQVPGQRDLPQEVFDILHEMKFLERNPDGSHGTKPQPTGLQFNRSKKHGRVWRMPDNQTARTAADRIDVKLRNLVEKLEQDTGRGRE